MQDSAEHEDERARWRSCVFMRSAMGWPWSWPWEIKHANISKNYKRWAVCPESDLTTGSLSTEAFSCLHREVPCVLSLWWIEWFALLQCFSGVMMHKLSQTSRRSEGVQQPVSTLQSCPWSTRYEPTLYRLCLYINTAGKIAFTGSLFLFY